jgi:hypothetical protein
LLDCNSASAAPFEVVETLKKRLDCTAMDSGPGPMPVARMPEPCSEPHSPEKVQLSTRMEDVIIDCAMHSGERTCQAGGQRSSSGGHRPVHQI